MFSPFFSQLTPDNIQPKNHKNTHHEVTGMLHHSTLCRRHTMLPRLGHRRCTTNLITLEGARTTPTDQTGLREMSKWMYAMRRGNRWPFLLLAVINNELGQYHYRLNNTIFLVQEKSGSTYCQFYFGFWKSLLLRIIVFKLYNFWCLIGFYSLLSHKMKSFTVGSVIQHKILDKPICSLWEHDIAEELSDPLPPPCKPHKWLTSVISINHFS